MVAGSSERICSVCDGKEVKELDLAPHKWENTQTVDKEATCIENGYMTYHCSVCDAVDESDIKIIEAKDGGCFIVMPSRKAPDGTYRDIAHPLNTQVREYMRDKILEAYEIALGENND